MKYYLYNGHSLTLRRHQVALHNSIFSIILFMQVRATGSWSVHGWLTTVALLADLIHLYINSLLGLLLNSSGKENRIYTSPQYLI